MTHIDKQGGAFVAVETLERVMHGLRAAVVRWAASIRFHYIARLYTKLVGIVSEKERKKYITLVKITREGTYQLSPAFTAAISQTEQEARTKRQQAQQARDQRPQQRPRHH